MIKITGLKKAVGDYQRLNNEGFYSPWYGKLMFDTDTGEVWTDEFYSIGHNEWKEYNDTAIVNIGYEMEEQQIPVTMKNVRDFIEANYMD